MLIFYPNKHTASIFTFTRHLFLLLFLNMYTHKFKGFANIVYPVQIITSKVANRNKKNKKRTCKNKIIYNTPIIYLLIWSHFILAFTLLCFNISMISD